MYWLYGIDTLLRITTATLVMFMAVPALAWPRPKALTKMEWFWWNLGVGITVLTIAGQLFTLLNIASALTYLALFAATIVVCRARRAGVGALQWIADAYRRAVLFVLKTIDRGAAGFSPPKLSGGLKPAAPLVYVAILAVAAFTRFYRPFATANLGFSDTYVHLYLMRLLDQGKQVDPAWGPYPRGMHFLLLAIQRLTNTDPILLLNFFGAFAGVLMALSVAWAARRVARSNTAALVAGLLFAMMIGGARQYFAFGGSVSSDRADEAREILSKPYSALVESGEFDVLLTAFQRQTSTLPQELAIVLLFPAALFLLDFLRERNRWHLAGFIGCTAAIAAIHSGVVVPLVALCAAAAVAALLCRATTLRDVVRGAAAGAIGIAIGSTWMLGFLRYRAAGTQRNVGSTALYYFPFLRSFVGGEEAELTAWMMLTPFLIVMLVVSALLVIFATKEREPHAVWIALATILFTCTHAASVLGIPELIEVRRNVTWLAMSVAALIGVAVAIVAARLPKRFALAAPALVLASWTFTLPNLFGPAMRERLLDYSGYGTIAYAVVRMSQQLEPYTWTLISYGQEYPMVLGKGFHLNGADFLERFDPTESPLRIPTPYVYIAVEKKPHRFEINNWTTRFERAAIEERLQTWCVLYRMNHRDMRVWIDDEHVRIYEIARGKGPRT